MARSYAPERTYYQWIAESIIMADGRVATDLRAAIRHAQSVPGDITPAQADRLGKLGAALAALDRTAE